MTKDTQNPKNEVKDSSCSTQDATPSCNNPNNISPSCNNPNNISPSCNNPNDISGLIIDSLQENESISSDDINAPLNLLHGALLSLEAKGIVSFKIEEMASTDLTEEGREVLSEGSQEYRLYKSIPEEGADISILEKYPHGKLHAFKQGIICKRGDRIYRNAENASDVLVEKLKSFAISRDAIERGKRGNDALPISSDISKELRRRNLIESKKVNRYRIARGDSFGSSESSVVELTSEIVQNFKNQNFKKYNFESTGRFPLCGSLHPLMKIKEEIKKIFLEMGFNEMKTDRYVESSFWNFDALFQPQNHPARDSHDTFFLSQPSRTNWVDGDYLKLVEKTHSEGMYGSIGHGSEWSKEEAFKNVLRTHTTAISSQYLKRNENKDLSMRLFSIDKVFRNESVDATHLAEFHQVEGIVVGKDLGIGELMGILKEFFNRLGISNIKFKPAFNPYTEPSMEIFGYHEGLKRWIEIGNSGIFRPEMLRPMGYGEDVSVLGWGLSLERPGMIKYGLSNIRELIGYKVDMNFIKKSEIVIF